MTEILRGLAARRRASVALQSGDLTLEARGEDVLVLRRRTAKETVTVCVNRANAPRQTDIPGAEMLEPLSYQMLETTSN